MEKGENFVNGSRGAVVHFYEEDTKSESTSVESKSKRYLLESDMYNCSIKR